jgi:hypothetical protein
MFYHVVFSVCATIQGLPEQCQSERLIDTMYSSLVSCYSAASTVEKTTVENLNTEAKNLGLEVSNIQVKTQCLTTREGEALLKKWGPSALVITGKKYD